MLQSGQYGHHFGNHLVHASSVSIAFRVYEAGPLPLEVCRDIACRSRRYPQSRPLSGIFSGGTSPSGCVPPWVSGADL